MFILKRQDVAITSVQHPTKDQPIPILTYQEQTYRLLSVFTSSQEEEARALWRDLTDNRGKACVLLEEPERFSIWGKVRLDQFDEDGGDAASGSGAGSLDTAHIQACLLLLQMLYVDVEDLLGVKQAKLFEKDISEVFDEWKLPQANSPKAVQTLLTVDPLTMSRVPQWQDHHLHRLLQELHRIGKDYFGNANFTERALDALEDMNPVNRKSFLAWLKESPTGKLWV